MTKRTYDYGVIIYDVKEHEYQRALELAGQTFRERYGLAPDVVALPRRVDPAGLTLWTMALAETYAPPGTVIVGAQHKPTPLLQQV